MPEQLTRTEEQVETAHGRLSSALEREMDMDAEDAQEIAGFVLAAFNGAEELDDREIDSDLRSVFYELEEHKLLAFRRETYRNDEGHKRRAFFWTICWDEVEPETGQETGSGGGQDTVYEELPSDAWQRAVGA